MVFSLFNPKKWLLSTKSDHKNSDWKVNLKKNIDKWPKSSFLKKMAEK